MTWFQSAIMGVIQGLTEFLPVSSSGHLAIINLFFGTSGDAGFDFSFFLHVATLLAAIVYFWRDIIDLTRSLLPSNKHMVTERKTVWYLVLACLVTGPMGLLLDDSLGELSSSTLALGIAYIGTTILLSATEYYASHHDRKALDQLRPTNALFIGLAQGIAVIPGISRAGSTIAGGMLVGLSKKAATRFSFLVGMPIILAGALKDGLDIMAGQIILPPFEISLVGFIAAAISGYLAIAWMIAYVSRIKLYWFAAYTGVLAVVLLIISFI